MSEPIRREGAQLLHTMPPGASIKMLRSAGEAWLQNEPLFVVAHPGGPPYFLYVDGRTEELTFDGVTPSPPPPAASETP